MAEDKKTVEKQLAVIAEFFGGQLAQAEILTKHRVNEQAYRAWQYDAGFTEEFDRRIVAAYRESAAVIARFAPKAAIRLIELTQSPKEEIARRACLDIISLHAPEAAPPRQPTGEPDSSLSTATASKILEALAEAATAAQSDREVGQDGELGGDAPPNPTFADRH